MHENTSGGVLPIPSFPPLHNVHLMMTFEGGGGWITQETRPWLVWLELISRMRKKERKREMEIKSNWKRKTTTKNTTSTVSICCGWKKLTESCVGGVYFGEATHNNRCELFVFIVRLKLVLDCFRAHSITVTQGSPFYCGSVSGGEIVWGRVIIGWTSELNGGGWRKWTVLGRHWE